jgi:hypothetical protein
MQFQKLTPMTCLKATGEIHCNVSLFMRTQQSTLQIIMLVAGTNDVRIY